MEYQGYRSWNAWNVSLWINNNEPLYRRAVELVIKHGRGRASRIMANELQGQKTPDGGRYNQTCIWEAMDGIAAS